MGELLTIWSVRLAVGCYLARYLLEFAFPRGGRGWILYESSRRESIEKPGFFGETGFLAAPSERPSSPAPATQPKNRRRNQLPRWFWTCGCALYLLHVICAFAFFHRWSHTLAYEQTAAQTHAVVGLDWGGGLYFNYLFTVVWVADVVRLWRGGDARGHRWIAVELFMAFMVVNATVVFGPPVWKWISVGILIGGGCWILFARRWSK